MTGSASRPTSLPHRRPAWSSAPLPDWPPFPDSRLGFVVARRHPRAETRKNKHIVDERAWLGPLRRCQCETRIVLRGHQAVGHQLCIAGKDHLVAFSSHGRRRREFAAHLPGASQLFVAREGRSRARRGLSAPPQNGLPASATFGPQPLRDARWRRSRGALLQAIAHAAHGVATASSEPGPPRPACAAASSRACPRYASRRRSLRPTPARAAARG